MRKAAMLFSFAALAAIGCSQAVKVASTLRTKLDFPTGTPIQAVGAFQLADSSFAVVVNAFDGARYLPAVAVFNRNGVMTSCFHWDRTESFKATVANVSSDGIHVYVAGRYDDPATSTSQAGWMWSCNTTSGLGFTQSIGPQGGWASTPIQITEMGNNILVGGYHGEASSNQLINGRPYIGYVDKTGMVAGYKEPSGDAFKNCKVTGLAAGGGRATVIGYQMDGAGSTVYMHITDSQTMVANTLDTNSTCGAIGYAPVADQILFAEKDSGGVNYAGVNNTLQFSFSNTVAGGATQFGKVGPDDGLIAVDAGLKITKYKYFDIVPWSYSASGLFSQPPINIVFSSLSEVYTGNYGKDSQAYLLKLSSTGVKRWDVFTGPANMTSYIPNGFDVHEKSGDILLAGTSRTANLDQLQVTVLRQAPTAIADSFYTPKNKQFYKSLVSNDRQALGSVATIIQAPTHGTASISSIGNLTYTPNNNFTGVDTVKYQLAKTGLTSSSAVCTLHVNP